jgi:hypothetical protein
MTNPNTGGLVLPPRTLAEVHAALAAVPPRVPGSGTRGLYVRLCGGLVKAVAEAGGSPDDAVRMLREHSPAWDAEEPAEKLVRTLADGGNAGAFWGIAEDHGFDLRRRGLERRELTVEERRAMAERRAEAERLAREREELYLAGNILAGGLYEAVLDVFDRAGGDPDLCAPDWQERLRERSLVAIPESTGEQWRLVLRTLFDPSARIFTGAPRDSGHPRHAAHFRTVGEILAMDRPFGIDRESGAPDWRITCATFPEGTFARLKANVERRLYYLIEADQLIGRAPKTAEERDINKRLCLALFRWLRSRYGVRFKAIIDTASKSLHGWASLTEDQAAILTEDLTEIRHPSPSPGAPSSYPLLDRAALINPAMIFRIPGCVHGSTGQPARLLYLDPTA